MAAVTRGQVMAWVEAYEAAWRSPGVEQLASLFAVDASYSTAPYDPPIQGLPRIGTFWEAEREGYDEEFTMTAEPVAVEGRTGVVRVRVRYLPPRPEYTDLWVITLDEDGRCTAFEEWPFAPPEN